MYFVEKTKNVSIFKRYDYILLSAVLLLTVFGLFSLESATRTMKGGAGMMRLQIISVILGVGIAIIISLIDYKILKNLSLVLYIATTLLLIIVLKFGTGREAVGSNSWLELPLIHISLQPSELAKISFIIMGSLFLERIKEGQGRYNYLKLIGFSVLPIGLVLLQPDRGTAMVFVVIMFTMLFAWGIKYRYIVLSLLAAAVATPLVWLALDDEGRGRIMEFLTPGLDPTGSSYQINKAKMAIGSGRMFGLGWGKGLQTQNPIPGGGIPVKESDSIIAVIGEEFGFFGTALVMLLVFVILIRCLYIAANSRELFGSYVSAGITGLFAFHFFENIAMNLGLLPMTGIPMPFVSAGGSAMVTNYIAIGILLSISLRRKKKTFS
ncbi:MAG: FtsW/RodA/SpoVE family cell cycle protein [Eubacteriales bacterium]|nr:FtsW/RodA/SpoVE family cell cycle protein [Eubacteriales bacterium]